MLYKPSMYSLTAMFVVEAAALHIAARRSPFLTLPVFLTTASVFALNQASAGTCTLAHPVSELLLAAAKSAGSSVPRRTLMTEHQRHWQSIASLHTSSLAQVRQLLGDMIPCQGQ